LTPRGRAEFAQAYEAIRAGLDENTFTAAVQAGRAMTFDQFVQLAQALCANNPSDLSWIKAEDPP